jgi:predicted extracellular nuclease
MRTLIPLLILVLCSTIFTKNALAQNFCHGKPCIQVGTFNIEWFGTPDKHSPRSPQTIKKIASLIADTLDLEILVLEEINSESEEFTLLRDALATRGYKLRRIGTSGGEQGVVIAYDADQVTLVSDDVKELNVRSDFDLGGGCVSSNLRVPIYGKFKAGNFDFVLVGVHLKSQLGVNGAAHPEKCADDIRRAQTQDILAALPSVLSDLNDNDVIIAGDFNAPLTDSSLGPLFGPGGFVSLTTNARRAAGSGTISYLKAPHREIIDHVLIRLANTAEWSNRSTFIFKPTPSTLNNYLKNTSDHAPVWTSFVTGN